MYSISQGTMDFGSTSTINLIASGSANIVGSTVNLNSGGSATAPTPADPSEALSAVISNISQTFELLVTDLPNPDPADPPLIEDDIHGLALNANDITYGSGGENIRDLEDLLSDMSSGIVAHTGVYPTDTGAHTATGTRTTSTAGKWSGLSPSVGVYAVTPLGPTTTTKSSRETK